MDAAFDITEAAIHLHLSLFMSVTPELWHRLSRSTAAL